MDAAMSQVIDYQLARIGGEELEGAYRALCSAILLRTAQLIASKPNCRKEEATNRRVAREWLVSGHGVISLADVCEVMDVDPVRILRGIEQHAEKMSDPAIRKSRKPRSHYIFGRSSPHVSRREVASAS